MGEVPFYSHKIPFFHHYFDIFQLLGEILDIRRAKLYMVLECLFLNEILTFSTYLDGGFSKLPVVVTIRTGFPNSSHLLPIQKPEKWLSLGLCL